MRNAVTMLFGVAIGAALSLAVAAGPLSKEGEQVVSITKAQWAAEMAKNTSGALKNIADDCTMFIPDYPSRLEGKSQIRTLFETGAMGGAGDVVMAEMANPHVKFKR